MPITNEQIVLFQKAPFPQTFKPAIPFEEKMYRGKDALMVKVGDKAFKWYANLDGQSMENLIEYGKQVNHDELRIRNLGLTPNQVPDSDFFISKYSTENPQLFAYQPWSSGRPLRDIPLHEILKNKKLRHNLGKFFHICGQRYQNDGQTVDLTGGKRIKLFGREFVDPTVFIWPFRTTNVLIEDDIPVLVDAKTNDPNAHSLVRQGVIFQTHVARGLGRLLASF